MQPANRNRRVAAITAGVALSMLGLAYASVPLYRLFCQTTGFGGTTQRAETAPAKSSSNAISVRFDANTSGSLDWSFHPAQAVMNVKIGERPTDEMLARREPAGSPPAPSDTEKPPDNVLASLKVQAIDGALRSQLNISPKTNGVAIQHVEAGSQGEAAGLQRGDVIQEVNREVVKSLEDYKKAAAKVKKEEMVVLLLSRQGNTLFVAVNPK